MLVAFDTSQRTKAMPVGEFSILRERNAAANPSYDTKFDLKQDLDSPGSKQRFSVPPTAPRGKCPELGVLHPSPVRAVQVAHLAAGE